MTTILSLPDIPEGKALEEFVSAFYQVSGFYVERNIVQRETEEVLELDIITTNYNVSPPNCLLTEVKSGRWGFSDLFKLCGWLHYLNLERAVFVATTPKTNSTFYKDKATKLAIKVICIADLQDAATPLAEVTEVESPDRLDVVVWRFSYWLDRVMGSDLVHKKKSASQEKRYEALATYLHTVNSGAFFQQTISERMDLLCSAYKTHPNISSRVAAEMNGKSFDGEYTSIPNELFGRTFYECEYNDLQLSSFVEHRARLALMKHATDFILFSQSGRHDIAKDSLTVKILGHDIEFSSYDALPITLRDGIETIKEQPYFYRYPVFWQWFMWAYGGFILLDKEVEEYAHMASHTGIPVEEIPNALRAYDALFPTTDTWFIDTSPNAHIRKLKMFPVPFMGLGVYYRRGIYCKNGKDFSNLNLTGRHTISDLVAWQNAAAKVLSK